MPPTAPKEEEEKLNKKLTKCNMGKESEKQHWLGEEGPENDLHRAETVVELREPADREGGGTIIRQRFKAADTDPHLKTHEELKGGKLAQTMLPEYSPLPTAQEVSVPREPSPFLFSNPPALTTPMPSYEKQQLLEQDRELAELAEKEAMEKQRKMEESLITYKTRSRVRWVVSAALSGAMGFLAGTQACPREVIVPMEVAIPVKENAPIAKIESSKQDIDSRLFQLELLKKKGRYKEALAMVENLLAEMPENLHLKYQKVQILEMWGRKWQALKFLGQMLESDDGSDWFKYLKAHYAQLKRELKGGNQ